MGKCGISSRKKCSEDFNECFPSYMSYWYRELSEGFFSDSNQKLLSGNAKDIPIYEAKLSRDLRIIVRVC